MTGKNNNICETRNIPNVAFYIGEFCIISMNKLSREVTNLLFFSILLFKILFLFSKYTICYTVWDLVPHTTVTHVVPEKYRSKVLVSDFKNFLVKFIKHEIHVIFWRVSEWNLSVAQLFLLIIFNLLFEMTSVVF